MTCVVGVRSDDGRVYLGGDSFCGDEETLDLCEEPKVFMVDEMGVGICGHIRQELILRSVLDAEVPQKKNITEEWIKHDLSEAFRAEAQEKGAGKDKDGRHTLYDSAYLLTYDGKFYYVDEDYGIWVTRRPYVAIGCGRQYALGSLHTCIAAGLHNTAPDQTVLQSLEAAAMWSPFVSGPMIVIQAK